MLAHGTWTELNWTGVLKLEFWRDVSTEHERQFRCERCRWNTLDLENFATARRSRYQQNSSTVETVYHIYRHWYTCSELELVQFSSVTTCDSIFMHDDAYCWVMCIIGRQREYNNNPRLLVADTRRITMNHITNKLPRRTEMNNTTQIPNYIETKYNIQNTD